MAKRIIVFAVCLLLSAVSVCAKQNVYEKLDSVEVIMGYGNFKVTFGLSKDGVEILPAEYEMAICQEIGLIAFYKDRDLLLYDTEGNLILSHYLDFDTNHRTSAVFERINLRDGGVYYELVVHYFDSSWGGQSIGTFCYRKGHLYQVKIIKELTLIK